jgi:hypothetical protein
MKSFMIVLFFLGLTAFSYSQEKKEGGSGEGGLKMEELPEVVIKSAGKDFSIYLPDKNPDKSVRSLQDKFIAYDLGKDYEGYETYLVTMEIDKGSLAATYNENGKLISVVENYKNVKLPSAVIYSVYKAFPGWQIVNDKFLYTQEDGDIIKKQYNLKIKKDNETRKLVVHPNGEILEGI